MLALAFSSIDHESFSFESKDPSPKGSGRGLVKQKGNMSKGRARKAAWLIFFINDGGKGRRVGLFIAILFAQHPVLFLCK